MKIAIVGGGALGSLFASYLANVSKNLWIYDVWQEHVDAINREGLVVTRNQTDHRVRLKATSSPGQPGIVDLVILLVKYQHTRKAAQDAISMVGKETAVLTLQNGIGNVEILQEIIPGKQLLFGLTTLPSELLGPGRIEDSSGGQGVTHFWPLRGKVGSREEEICSIFNRAGLRTEISPDIEHQIWKKLVVNCSYAVLAAITRIKVGDLMDREELEPILDGIASEIVMVAQKKGIALEKEKVRTFARQVAEEGRHHIPSILGDVLKRRKTEIECLNGSVIREAARLGIVTPFNQALYGLVRTIEDTYDKRLG